MPPDFRYVSSPLDTWAAQPSFLLGELLFITGALLCLWHARRSGRANVLIWLAALVAGTANDTIFMVLPLVDNFWQAQGTLMLTPRMPLYIPCVYVCFMYLPTVAARRWRLSLLGTASTAGLMAALFYAPYDIVGARFLWWTWHDTDVPIAVRVLGAPAGSTLWVVLFTGAFAFLVEHTLRRAEAKGAAITGRVFGLGFAKVAGLSTLLMMLQITPLQLLDGGAPGHYALLGAIVLYGATSVAAFRRARRPTPARLDAILGGFVVTHLVALGLIGTLFDPSTHVSAGVHQPVGECYVEQTDITGFTRHAFLCVSDFDEEFDFSCVDAPPTPESIWSTKDTHWYTICGTPTENRGTWLAGLWGLALSGAGLMWLLLGFRWRGAAMA